MPDSAAAVCFIAATSAEDVALHRALRDDLPKPRDPSPRVRVRGSKNKRRDRFAPIVSDEQQVLLEFVRKHAQGKDGMLFGTLQNLRRDLGLAARAAKIPHVWPHALRKAAGQFLIDLQVPGTPDAAWLAAAVANR
jgi:integrase